MSNVETNQTLTLSNSGGEATRPASLNFDPSKYRAEVDEFDITETQKLELLATLWSIMRSFVELGFTVDVCSALLGDHSPIPNDEELG